MSLESRIDAAIPILHLVHLWPVKHATDIYIKFSVGTDGMTPYRRLKGKKCSEEHIEFGEVVLYKKKNLSGMQICPPSGKRAYGSDADGAQEKTSFLTKTG